MTNGDEEGSVLLAGILSVRRKNCAHNNNDNSFSGDENDSDKGSTCGMEISVFFDTRNTDTDNEEKNLEDEDDEDYI